MIRQLSQRDVQIALATRSGEWLTIDHSGRMKVDLTALAAVVHDIGNDMLTRGIAVEVAHRYRLLAGAMRIAGTSPTLGSPQARAALEKFSAGLERRARALETVGITGQ